jgi:hypothetical protein
MSARAAAPAKDADSWVSPPVADRTPVKPVADATGPLKRLTIDLDADLHRRFKSICAAHDLKMADEVRQAIEARLAQLAS